MGNNSYICSINLKIKEMKTEDKAKRVLEVFPSLHELMNSESMNFLIEHRIMNPMAVFAFRNSEVSASSISRIERAATSVFG